MLIGFICNISDFIQWIKRRAWLGDQERRKSLLSSEYIFPIERLFKLSGFHFRYQYTFSQMDDLVMSKFQCALSTYTILHRSVGEGRSRHNQILQESPIRDKSARDDCQPWATILRCFFYGTLTSGYFLRIRNGNKSQGGDPYRVQS